MDNPTKDIVVIGSKTTKARAALVAVVVCALFGGWLAAKWQLGNMLASLTRTGDPNVAQIAELAVNWAPADPNAVWLKASSGNILQMFEHTARLAPHDYRWQMELGRALEQDGQPQRAEAAMIGAVELAPSYAFPKWQLGNFYLRQGRTDEAFVQLEMAAANNRAYRDQVFSLAWEFFDKDAAAVERLAGESPDARARLAYFFAARGRAEDSLRNWNLLSDDDKAANPETAKAIAHGLYIQKQFPQSLEFARQLGIDADSRPEALTNGSFEKGLGDAPDSRFSWSVTRGDARLDIASDAKLKPGGNRSLRISFKNFVKPELYNVFQTVVVGPNTRYRLKFQLRTEKLKSSDTPLLEVVNANTDIPLARTPPFPAGTNDWQEVTLEFMTPANCNGLIIRTARVSCGAECPITGTLWYDDFEIGRGVISK